MFLQQDNMNKYNLNNEDINEFLKKGLNVLQISTEIGCCTSLIYLYCKKNSISLPVIDLVGKSWKDLKVIEKIGSRGPSGQKSIYWKCECICGNITELSTSAINGEKQRSCGCYISSIEYRDSHSNFKGYKDIHGKYWGNLKRSANKRGHKFKVSIKDAWKLFEKQKGLCALTGLKIEFAATNKDREDGKTTASLDRIDSLKGYTIDNIQWIHKEVNFMKQQYSQEYFIYICNLIAKNHPINLSKIDIMDIDMGTRFNMKRR